mgnify:CR=1 FL=1
MRVLLTIIITLLLIFSPSVYAAEEQNNGGDDNSFDITEMIMSHIGDSHEFHIVNIPRKDKEDIKLTIPLPIILWYDGGLHIFSSSKIYDNEVVESRGSHFLLNDEKIYVTDEYGHLSYNEESEITNTKPFDISITKNVATMFLAVITILLLAISAGRIYKQSNTHSAPKGTQRILEPVVIFVRDEIINTNIEKGKADFFAPFLLTLFLFIWISNLLGVIPFFPGGANLSGNIAYTFTLAIFAFLATNIFGSKAYWKEILTAPGAPIYVKIFLVPIEIIGMFTKPFALMLRLFANITAGHIIILSLASIIFVLETIYASPLTILLSLIMFTLELLVATLQAYIFTLLTALFIGMAVKSEH